MKINFENFKDGISHWPIYLLGVLFCGVLMGATLFGGAERMKNIIDNANRFKEVLTIIETNYVDSVGTDSLVNYAITKLVEKLDPHTSYIPKEDMIASKIGLEAGFDGIGIEFNFFNDTLFIVTAIANGPSEAVGLKSGDKIIAADGVALSGAKVTNRLIYKSLRGVKGSIVKLKVMPYGKKELKEVLVTRDRIPTYSVSAGYMLDEQTGLIKIDRFSATAYTEFKATLEDLKAKKNLKRLIIDLRGNTGGYKDKAEKIVDELIGGEKLIVSTDGKGTRFDTQSFTHVMGSFEKEPVIVLIDEGSASASEIVSGALQDHDRALVIGRRSFGKGLVQQPIPLSDGGELRMTISRYYTPSGRSIQKPYVLGDETSYRKDLELRKKKGEFFVEDSIKQNKNLAYKTTNGRTVYGGGGIMPDLFVPKDTSSSSEYLTDLLSKNILREYALTYANNNRKQLENLPFPNFNKEFNLSDAQLLEIKNIAKSVKIKVKEGDVVKSRSQIKLLTKAFIAKNIWKAKVNSGLYNEFYQVLYQDDPVVTMALQNIGKAEKLGKTIK